MNNIVDFLTKLTQNNNRDWYHAHKNEYQKARKSFEKLVDSIIGGISQFDSQVNGLTAKACMFRIYRDVRFSKDKRPYKTNFGAFMAEGGRKSTKAGYYVHVDPEGCFLGGGLYHPDASQLKKVRQQIDYNAEDLRKIISDPEFKKVYGNMQGTQLKTAPRDFSKDHPDIDLLRYKDFLGTHAFGNEVVEYEDAAYIVKKLEVLKPFNDYFNEALAFEGEEPGIDF